MKKIMPVLVIAGVMVCSVMFITRAAAQSEAADCTAFTAQQCPLESCAVAVNCRGVEVCTEKPFDPPVCGTVAYEGQDVACCEGLVHRCGVAFLDDTCDMFGDNSEYSFPICIPCGDGICNNFENICNCPEDCWLDGDREYTGQLYDMEKTASEEE